MNGSYMCAHLTWFEQAKDVNEANMREECLKSFVIADVFTILNISFIHLLGLGLGRNMDFERISSRSHNIHLHISIWLSYCLDIYFVFSIIYFYFIAHLIINEAWLIFKFDWINELFSNNVGINKNEAN